MRNLEQLQKYTSRFFSFTICKMQLIHITVHNLNAAYSYGVEHNSVLPKFSRG